MITYKVLDNVNQMITATKSFRAGMGNGWAALCGPLAHRQKLK